MYLVRAQSVSEERGAEQAETVRVDQEVEERIAGGNMAVHYGQQWP